MSEGYLLAPGVETVIEQMVVPKAQQLAAFLERGAHPWARLVGLRLSAASDQAETIVFDVDVEVGQEPVHGILPVERIAVSFRASDRNWPEVLALRLDFPRNVPHLFPTRENEPCSLCLYEESYDELKLRWTAQGLIEQIRFWLRETSRGTLHAHDQPLEPLFAGGYESLILHPSFFSQDETHPKLHSLARCEDGIRGSAYVAIQADTTVSKGAGKFVATIFHAPPSVHGVIRFPPRNLHELHSVTSPLGLDILAGVRSRICEWRHDPSILKSQLILIVVFPKSRVTGSTPEVLDTWAFVTAATVYEVGEKLGLWQADSRGVVGLLIGTSTEPGGSTRIEITPLIPRLAMTRDMAAVASGLSPDVRRIVAIGVGALGSQIVGILVRSGYGRWQFVDQDLFLPHNAARHALPHALAGLTKVRAMTQWVNMLLAESIVDQGIIADVLDAGDQASGLETAFKGADVIADFSANVAVARYLARDSEGSARRLSAFLNPSGSAVVVLVEDSKRQIPLDCLEMQYYRALLEKPELCNHFAAPAGRIRTARSCRDVSAVLPCDLVSLHAAVASRGIRKALAQDAAIIAIWTTDADLNTHAVVLQAAPVVEQEASRFRLLADIEFIEELRALRSKKLPLETGGVLLGSWDLERRFVYAVATIPSPSDSEECPDSYIRGSEGLLRAVQQAQERTGGQVQYIGEWHSHPDGWSSQPSEHDHELFAWLQSHLEKDGFPPVMLIVGENELRWVVGSL